MPQNDRRAICREARPRRAARNVRSGWALLVALLAFAEPRAEEEGIALEPSEPTSVEQGYGEAMSRGLDALARGRLLSAGTNFEAADRARPGDPAAADGLGQVRQAEKLASLRRKQRRAREFEARDEWAKALAEYRVALATDSRLVFAREGERRSQERGALLADLDEFVAHPERLESREVLEQARSLSTQGLDVPGEGSRTQAQARELERLVRLANTSIPVVIESDGLTAVQIYKVGNIGSFERKELALLPGRYTVVGSRDGYRDVRREFRVEIGKTPEAVRVICTEPMR